MISKLALAALAAAVSAEDIEAIYPNTLYRRDGGSHSHASSSRSVGQPTSTTTAIQTARTMRTQTRMSASI